MCYAMRSLIGIFLPTLLDQVPILDTRACTTNIRASSFVGTEGALPYHRCHYVYCRINWMKNPTTDILSTYRVHRP